MNGNVLIWILAIIAVLSLGLSAAALIIQLKRKKKMDKQSDAMIKNHARYEPVNVQAQQPDYSQQNAQARQINNPYIHDDYEEKTQSLWSSPNMPPVSDPYSAVMPTRNCYKLYINESSYQGVKNYELDVMGDLTVGRAGTSGLVISDNTVSGLQCVLLVKPEGIYVENKSGSNITQLNGVTLSGASLIKPHDTIKIGKVELKILNIQKTM
jgi:hypothetical protein